MSHRYWQRGWRDQLFKSGPSVFDDKQRARQESRLVDENRKLKTMIGELTVELKKSDEMFG